MQNGLSTGELAPRRLLCLHESGTWILCHLESHHVFRLEKQWTCLFVSGTNHDVNSGDYSLGSAIGGNDKASRQLCQWANRTAWVSFHGAQWPQRGRQASSVVAFFCFIGAWSVFCCCPCEKRNTKPKRKRTFFGPFTFRSRVSVSANQMPPFPLTFWTRMKKKILGAIA